MAAYHHEHFDVQLNLFNLTDERYFEWGRSNAALPGRPFAAEVDTPHEVLSIIAVRSFSMLLQIENLLTSEMRLPT